MPSEYLRLSGGRVAALERQGFRRLKDLFPEVKPIGDPAYCRCAEPDIWVAARSQGNEYRCGNCGGCVTGMEASRA